MPDDDLDELDREIVYRLQTDARHTSSGDIGRALDVSPSTVRKRITRLEDRGVVRGYHADVDFEVSGYQLLTLIVCTAPIPEREELAAAATDVSGVVEVQEIMSGKENVLVRAIGRDSDDLTRIGEELDELGLEVSDEDLIRNTYRQPFAPFTADDERED